MLYNWQTANSLPLVSLPSPANKVKRLV
uniref:Uncharacterized protein n=1 Tax=Anguilla anguilla TaxID=7936 RepID=A0A0E9T5S0_ANGAN